MSRAELKMSLVVSCVIATLFALAFLVLCCCCVGLMNEVGDFSKENARLHNLLRNERINNDLLKIDVEHIARTAGVPIPRQQPAQ